MPDARRVILLEFNELTPSLVDRFISEGALPNFKRLRDTSERYLTTASEQPPYLEPWIQWVTVHTGLDYREHGLFRLDEGHTLPVKRIWDVAADAGRSSWVCGSMNVRYEANFKGCVLPDPWCTHVPAQPSELRGFFRFIQTNVLEYTNERVPLSKGDYLKVGAFLVGHGLSPQTVKTIVAQLASERSGHNRWRRAVILDRLQFDVFRSYYKKTTPALSTFFLNSTAHYQHAYWRNMNPEPFAVKPSEEEQAEYGPAILFGYQEMDRMIGQFLQLAGNDTTIVFATALSQQPYLRFEDRGGALFYRPKDFAELTAFAGITEAHQVAPVMTHQFHLEFASEAIARDAEEKLQGVKVDDRRLLQVERTGKRVFSGSDIYSGINEAAVLSNASGKTARFFDIFYKVDAMKSGMHHPEGLLWIQTPDGSSHQHDARVPLAAVAPTLLRLMDLPVPAHMKSEPLQVSGFATTKTPRSVMA